MPKIDTEKKVKFSISITPECNEVLTEFVKVAGSTKSAFISDALQDQIETLKELTKSLKKVQADAAKKAAEKVAKKASIT